MTGVQVADCADETEYFMRSSVGNLFLNPSHINTAITYGGSSTRGKIVVGYLLSSSHPYMGF